MRIYTREPIIKRFVKQLQIGPNGCWNWKGAKVKGYGQINAGGRGVSLWAHRVSYDLFVGPIPEGLVLDHLCRNPACVRPDHLEPVTQKVNILRGASEIARRAASTACRRGHPYDKEYLDAAGRRHRRCSICSNRKRNN